MIQGYTRKPTKFDWCGAEVWLMKLTKAQRDAVFGGDDKGFFVDLAVAAVTNDKGEPIFTDRTKAIEYFDAEVAEDDCAALAKLILRHSGLEGDTEKKS